MEEVNRNEQRLPEPERNLAVPTVNATKDEPAWRNETIRSVNPGQVLPLMQVSLRNSKRSCVRVSVYACMRASVSAPSVVCPRRRLYVRDSYVRFRACADVEGVINRREKGFSGGRVFFEDGSVGRETPDVRPSSRIRGTDNRPTTISYANFTSETHRGLVTISVLVAG